MGRASKGDGQRVEKRQVIYMQEDASLRFIL